MRTIAIIGGGFSGTTIAVQLLRLSRTPLRIVLINRCDGMARGIAYGTNSPLHLLNVPAGNMSALVDEPQDFLRYCQAQAPETRSEDFVLRRQYGNYLYDLLERTRHNCATASRLDCLHQEVIALTPHDSGVHLALADGEKLFADHVVLAFGHFTPLDPPGIGAAREAGRYRQDPWASAAPEVVKDAPLLLVGSGLTAMDVALTLRHKGHHGPLYLLSRRGLRPLSHRGSLPNDYDCTALLERLLQGPASIRVYLREIRLQVSQDQLQGFDWRDLLARLRAHTPALWQRLPVVERRRFLRHAQVYWDAHRHRVAPAAYQTFQQCIESGLVRPLAGRIVQMTEGEQGVDVRIRLRHGQQCCDLAVAQVINCTGPNSDLARVDEPLIRQLKDGGWLVADPLGTGLCVDSQLAVRDRSGHSLTWLSYVGPMLKADFWEATAVPELRQHAFRVARRLVS